MAAMPQKKPRHKILRNRIVYAEWRKLPVGARVAACAEAERGVMPKAVVAARAVADFHQMALDLVGQELVAEVARRFGPPGAAKQSTLRKQKRTKTDKFYTTWAWKKARMEVLRQHGRRCMCCGWAPDHGGDNYLVVDHVKPLALYPDLALDIANLQVLCNDCNMGKARRDYDFRKEAAPG